MASLQPTQKPMSISRLIDSHIHLYAESHLSSLNWTEDLPEGHRLKRQNSVAEYRAAAQSCPEEDQLLGFVFLETDRKSGLRDDEWSKALNEVDFLVRIARGTPRSGEGHVPDDSKLVLGIVPWAPVAAGAKGLATYVQQVQQRAGEKWNLIKGFRYLLQDKSRGTMLQPHFVEGLQWLGQNNLTFDLGVDARSGGLHQLQEACELLDRLYDDGDDETLDDPLKVIINHLCKPNLRLAAPEALAGHPDFTGWKECVERMARHGSTYMKLSGLFSELPEQDEQSPIDTAILVAHTKPWVDVIFRAFGPTRIMFGSDWPVCNVGGPGMARSWTHWHALAEEILSAQALSIEEKEQVWCGTAMNAYSIQLA